MKISVIYIIKSKVKPERFYIGSAVNFVSRKNGHISSFNKQEANKKLQRHVNKYGREDLNFEFLERVHNASELIQREQYYIDLYKPFFNVCPTAGSPLGTKRTNEQKAQMSKRLKGRVHSPESIKKMSESKKGYVHSEISKQKISISKKGVPLSEETRLNIIKSLTGRICKEETKIKLSIKSKQYRHTAETKKKMSDAWMNRVVSEETKIKNSIASKGRKHSEETKEKIRRANLGRKYPPITEETRRKLSLFQSNRPPRSAETCEKIRQSKLGKPFPKLTEEQKLKRQISLTGKKRSQEFKDNLSRLRKGVKRKPEDVAKSVQTKRINFLLKKSA